MFIRTMNNHNKADGFERRLEACQILPVAWIALMTSYSYTSWKTSSMPLTSKGMITTPAARSRLRACSYVYYTQIMQAEVRLSRCVAASRFILMFCRHSLPRTDYGAVTGKARAESILQEL
jgi:hypothetical protein